MLLSIRSVGGAEVCANLTTSFSTRRGGDGGGGDGDGDGGDGDGGNASGGRGWRHWRVCLTKKRMYVCAWKRRMILKTTCACQRP